MSTRPTENECGDEELRLHPPSHLSALFTCQRDHLEGSGRSVESEVVRLFRCS